MEYYSAKEKKEIMLFVATWLQLEIIMLHEVSQKGKEKYIISLMCDTHRKAMPKNVQTTARLYSSHTLAKQCLQFSKPGFNNT